eukprot:6190585-Pleurochrysis_carterae.AAC.2
MLGAPALCASLESNLLRNRYIPAACPPFQERDFARYTRATYRLPRATLTESSFVEAKIDGADFTGAIDVHTVDFAATTGTPIGIPPSPPI